MICKKEQKKKERKQKDKNIKLRMINLISKFCVAMEESQC